MSNAAKTVPLKHYLHLIRIATDSDDRHNLTLKMVEAYGKDCIGILVKLLEDENEDIRAVAFHGLSLIPSEEAASRIVPLLSHENIQIKNLAIELLNQYEASAIPSLLCCLRSQDRNLRKFAADILGLIGDETVAPPLISLLGDPEPIVAVSAADALGHLKATEAAPELIRHFDANPGMQPVVIEALGKLGSVDADRFLISVLRKDDANLSLIALEALRSSRHPETVMALEEALSWLPLTLRPHAFKAICSILNNLNEPSESFFDFQKHHRDILDILHHSEDQETFCAVFDCLPDAFIIENFPGILELLNHDGDNIRHFVLERLKHLDKNRLLKYIEERVDTFSIQGQLALLSLLDSCEPACACRVLKKLADSYDPEIRIMVAQIAATHSGREFEIILRRLAKDTDENVQEAAYLALCDRAHPGLIPIFKKGLNSPSRTVCGASLHALSLLQPDRVIGQLKQWLQQNACDRVQFLLSLLQHYPQIISKDYAHVLLNHADPEVRIAAIHAFENCDDTQVQQLMAGLQQNDPDRRVRLTALRVLAHTSRDQAVAAISRALEDDDYEIQHVALEAATYFNCTEVAPKIFPLLGSSDRKVQIKAVQALMKMLGEQGLAEAKRHLASYGEDVNHIVTLADEAKLKPVLTEKRQPI